MKIAVLGAGGKTGRAFVNVALEAGHLVRAGVYRPAEFEKSDHIEVLHCDALERTDVDKLIKGCDAVVSLIGHVEDSPAFLQTTATSHILSAMKDQHIRRFISLTGTGVRQPGDNISLTDYLMNAAVRIVDAPRVHDGIAHAKVVAESDRDWTIVRVLKLTEGRATRYVLTPHGPAIPFVSRRTVAEAILAVLEDRATYGTMPILSR